MIYPDVSLLCIAKRKRLIVVEIWESFHLQNMKYCHNRILIDEMLENILRKSMQSHHELSRTEPSSYKEENAANEIMLLKN